MSWTNLASAAGTLVVLASVLLVAWRRLPPKPARTPSPPMSRGTAYALITAYILWDLATDLNVREDGAGLLAAGGALVVWMMARPRGK
jgi:hypothetical protein